MPRRKGSGNRVRCAFNEDVSDIPDSIMYFPEGEHTIHASVNGKPKTVTVKVDKTILAAFQSGLEERLGRKKGARPNTDFDHEGKGKASSLPQKFSYVDGEGLFLHIDWTAAGRSAIEGKDYSYFSPDFLLGADGVPTGIPMRGPIGTLTNDPAFETIQRIAASDAGDQHQQPERNMSDILKDIGLLSANEAAKEDAQTVAAKRVTALKAEPDTVRAAAVEEIQSTIRDAVKATDADADQLGVSAALAEDADTSVIAKTFGSLIAACAQNAKEAADAKVKAAQTEAQASVDAMVKAGKIPAKCDELKEFWLKQFTDDKDAAEKVAASMPKIAPGITEKVIGKSVSASSSALADKAQELVQAGRAKDIQEAEIIALGEDEELYKEYQAANGLSRED